MRRHPVPALAVLCFAAFVLLHAVDRPLYVAVLDALHTHPAAHPFLDTRFVTAQVECWSRGVDVYATNPCDPLGRTLDYSPLWLRLPFLAQPDSATPILGLATDGIFLAALAAMPWALAGGFDVTVALGATLSWATIFGMERGNTDLLMFAAAVLFARLTTRSLRARCAGYALVLGVGLLKFYPLTMLALVLRERRAHAVAIGAACALALALFVAAFHAELARIGANMASSPFGDMFGARSLPYGIPILLSDVTIRGTTGLYVGLDALAPRMRPLAWGLLAGMTALSVLGAVLHGRDPALRRMLDRTDADVRALLLAGAVLCVGCFFGHQNIGYRALLLLLVLPGLLALARAATDRSFRRVYRLNAAVVVLLAWGGIVSRSFPGWLAVELGWWWIVTILLAVAIGVLGGPLARFLGVAGLSPRAAAGA